MAVIQQVFNYSSVKPTALPISIFEFMKVSPVADTVTLLAMCQFI